MHAGGDAPVASLPGQHTVDQRADCQHGTQNTQSQHDSVDHRDAEQRHRIAPQHRADHEQQVQNTDAHNDPVSHAGALRRGFRVTAWAAVPDKADQYYGDHGHEHQDAAQGQCQVETGRSVPLQLFKSKHGSIVGEHAGDTPLVVLTKEDVERTVYLTKVKRLYFHKSPLAPRIRKEERAVAGIADFNCAQAEEYSDLFEGGIRSSGCTPRDSIGALEPTGPLREIRRRLYSLDRRSGIVVVEKRSLEAEVLISQFPTTLAVVGHKYTQVLIGQKQQQTIHRRYITAMPDRSLAVVAEIEKAVGGAQEARVGGVQRAVHLLHRALV